MKVMIFVLDNLDISESLNTMLLNLYEVWNNMYIMSRFEEFDDQNLKGFEVIRYIAQYFEFIRIYYPIFFFILTTYLKFGRAQLAHLLLRSFLFLVMGT